MNNGITADDSKKPVLNEIATVQRDPLFMDYIGKTLLNPDKVLKSESGGKGIELYEDLLRDDKVGSALQTRQLAVVGREWEVIPATDKRQDQKIADFVREVFLNFNYDAARKMLLSGTVLGFKPGEVMWEYSEGSVWIKDIIGKPARRFIFDLESKLRLLTISNMIEGEALPERKFIVFRNISDNGSPYGDGLGRMLYWPVWFKKNAIKFWMIFADKFGSPTIWGKYPSGVLKEQQDKLFAVCESMQQEAVVVTPDNMMIELLEAARQGSVNTYESLCNFMNSAIAQVLLGHTGTSQSTPGKLGSEDAAIDVKAEYVKADADMLCACQNSMIVKWLVDYNFPGVTKYPKVWIRTKDEEDLKPLAERDQILVNIGVPIAKQYFYDTYGIPEPQEGEEIISGRQSAISDQGKTEARSGNGEFVENPGFADQQAIDDFIESISPEQLQAQLEGVLKPVIDLINEGNSYNEIMEKISGTYPEMNTSAVESMLQRAIYLSEAWGRMNA